MDRRNFLGLGVLLAAPLSWLRGKAEDELKKDFFDASEALGDNPTIDVRMVEEELLKGYVIVEDFGTFGTLTNGYRFKLAVREVVEDISTDFDDVGGYNQSIIGAYHLEGRFLCDPPSLCGKPLVIDMFWIESPSLKSYLRTFADGTFKSNGVYHLSEEVAGRLRGK